MTTGKAPLTTPGSSLVEARDLPALLAEGEAAVEALESIGQHIRHEFPYSGESRLPTIANVVRDLVAALREAVGE